MFLLLLNMALFIDPFWETELFRSKPRAYRLQPGPFENLDDLEFYSRYRLSKFCLRLLCDELRVDLMRKTNRSHALSVESQVLAALRYYGAGSFQLVTGDTIGSAVIGFEMRHCRIKSVVHRVRYMDSDSISWSRG